MGIIEISGLSKYYGRSRGVGDVSLSINEGEIFGFIGPNGAGKSTTIRVLLNLIYPSSGSASIMGMDAVRQSKEIKKLIGYIPSDAGFYDNMSVMEFLIHCSGFYGAPGGNLDRINELCTLFELDTSRDVSALSTGNKKKVSIIQALIHRPKLLIMDEPTTGLDPLMQAKFFGLLRSENKKGTTIFFSSHILSEVQTLCGRVAIIKEGRIVKIEEIASLRHKQLKKVHVIFGEPAPITSLGLSGVVSPEENDGGASFLYSGPINELVAAMAKKRVRNLTIEEPPLEEVFMHYYKDGEK